MQPIVYPPMKATIDAMFHNFLARDISRLVLGLSLVLSVLTTSLSFGQASSQANATSNQISPSYSEQVLNPEKFARGLVTVQTFKGSKQARFGSGFVVLSDRFNGFVATSAALLKGQDKIKVVLPSTGEALTAQIIRIEYGFDLAILKVNGLNTQALQFSNGPVNNAAQVWSVLRDEAGLIEVFPGKVMDSYELAANKVDVITHSAAQGLKTQGSVLMNLCGQVIGLNMSFNGESSVVNALASKSLLDILKSLNIKTNKARKACIPAIALAKEKVDSATQEAKTARQEAEAAQRRAEALLQQLNSSQQKNVSLAEQVKQARDRVEEAIVAAEAAQQNAQQVRIDLEKQTAAILAETQAVVAHLNQDKLEAEKRFQRTLESQQRESKSREITLLGAFALGGLIIIAVIFVMLRSAKIIPFDAGKRATDLRRFGVVEQANSAAKPLDESEPKHSTQMQRSDFAEYVLEGRDEDGIRYLLRISGDKVGNGAIIGRNPDDSPYIINHVDVSRRHARLKVMKSRVFIEDLGSTNGTSVNGQNIEDKGPVSVVNGDQIIIGSIVMKLKIMTG